uniref:Uncharacterized protein n=1 Tax=Anopheles atroparvus TaxID=41427 RepID=A0A182INY6_ANOAO
MSSGNTTAEDGGGSGSSIEVEYNEIVSRSGWPRVYQVGVDAPRSSFPRRQRSSRSAEESSPNRVGFFPRLCFVLVVCVAFFFSLFACFVYFRGRFCTPVAAVALPASLSTTESHRGVDYRNQRRCLHVAGFSSRLSPSNVAA